MIRKLKQKNTPEDANTKAAQKNDADFDMLGKCSTRGVDSHRIYSEVSESVRSVKVSVHRTNGFTQCPRNFLA